MSKTPQLYKFKDIENRLHTLEPGKSYIKPFVTSKVSNTMCGGLNFLNKVSVPWDLTCDEIIYCMKGTFRLTCDGESYVCSPVSTDPLSASSSIRSRGRLLTYLSPVSLSLASATWFLIHFSKRSRTVLFFLTTNSQGRSSGVMAKWFATFVLKSPFSVRLVAQLGLISRSRPISPTPMNLATSPRATSPSS